MAAKRTTAVNLSLEFQATQEQRFHQPQIKMEEEEEEEEDDKRVKGPRVIQAESLRHVLGWVAPDRVKQEPDEELPQSWETPDQEHLNVVPSLRAGWGNPQHPDEVRWKKSKRQEQQVPVLFEEMDTDSPKAEHLLVDRRRLLQREVQHGLAGEAVGTIVQTRGFPKMSRRGTNWSYAEVIDLLDIWGEQRIQQVLQSSHRNMDTFQVIASQMAKRGHERTAQECRTKTKTLRREYKRVKESSGAAGKGRPVCPFYDQLERILDSSAQASKRVRNFAHPEESSEGDHTPPGGPEEGIPQEENEDYLERQDFFDPSTQFSIELVDSEDSSPVICKTEETFEEEPICAPQLGMGADHLPSLLPPALHSVPGSPATTGSTADVHVTPSHSPLPDPTSHSAAERLANLRNRHKKTRNDLAMELAKAADQRMQAATDRILSALDGYAKADLEEREKDRVGTEQIIAIMHRQTELLELLVRQQTLAPAALSPAPSRHAWTPRTGQSSHRPTGPSPSRLGVPRRPLTPRARNRRRPQNYSP